eukprot:6460832-Amphidinium_carterae.1
MNNLTGVTAYVAPFAVELTDPIPSSDISSSAVCVSSQLASWTRLEDKVEHHVTTLPSGPSWPSVHRRVVTDRDTTAIISDEIVAG